ncbi:MAG: TonB-dependent receptor plug domain-containing protein, partial [Kangiellaceae bacterium]|nr:TonB-dependent receptor plug domain-containing protein [Kangiellaceae bacterium]
MQHIWLLAVIAYSLSINDVLAASEQEGSEEESKLVVTGSLIKKSAADGPSPLISISAEDILKLGHTNLFEVLSALTAQTGSLLEGDQFPNGFAAAAQTINLRGFGPGRTLVLVNGQRFALNPTPYQSESNFFNLAIIPTTAIERVDVLTDGASSIYGSDAVAGVINVILREEFETSNVDFTVGNTTEGGGRSARLSAGHSIQTKNVLSTFGFQWEDRAPIYGRDRPWLSQVEPTDVAIGAAILDTNTQQLLGATQQNCNAISMQLVTSTQGDFCTDRNTQFDNLRNDRQTWSLFNHTSLEQETGKLFLDFIYWESDVQLRTSPLFWVGDINNQIAVRQFSPIETGNQDKIFDEDSASFIVGFEGVADYFDYRITYSNSIYNSNRAAPRLNSLAMESFFTQASDVFNPLTVQDFQGVLGSSRSDAESSSQTLAYWQSGELGEMDDRRVEYALIV